MKKLTKVQRKKFYKDCSKLLGKDYSFHPMGDPGLCYIISCVSNWTIKTIGKHSEYIFAQDINKLPELNLFNIKSETSYLPCDKQTRQIILDLCYNMC